MTEKRAARRSAPAQLEVNAEQVATYLRQHPDFFADHENLLAELQLPHGQRGSVSLIERQLELLRQRQLDARERMNELVRTANVNQRIFEATLSLTLALIDSQDLTSLCERLEAGLREHFEVDAATLCAIGSEGLAPELAASVRVADPETAQSRVGSLLQRDRVVCGVLRDAELGFLFPYAAESIRSAAVMPLPIADARLLLAMGSQNPDHFAPEMGTQFVRFVGEVAARLLIRRGAFVPAGDAGGALS